MVWLLGNLIEKERTDILLNQDDNEDSVMRAILGIHGTPWGIFVAVYLIEKIGVDVTKLSLQKMRSPEFSNALAKYAKRAMELYPDIAVNILSSEDEDSTSPRNQIRVKSFLDKLRRNLNLRVGKISQWKLPKLQSVVSSIR